MKPQYLKLTDGREVRIMWNMNALGNFTRLTGKEMADLARPDVNTLRTVAWCSALEGEEAEGRVLGLDEVQFGRLIDMAGIVKFSEILTDQASGVQKKSPAPGNSPLNFFRRKGIDLGEASKFTYAYMRRFALGALLYDPMHFGNMMVGDFMDALSGYNEAELERVKVLAELIRKCTTLLWNTQVIEESRSEPVKLWPLPWDQVDTIKKEPVSEEVKKEIDRSHENILSNM